MTKPEFFSEARHDLSGPLAGIRVVEATTTAAGPLCSAMLADLGADAIKVETPRRRGESAATASSGDKVSWAQATFNRNKRSLILDLGRREGPRYLPQAGRDRLSGCAARSRPALFMCLFTRWANLVPIPAGRVTTRSPRPYPGSCR
jgi:hypothetical protein